MFKIFVLFLASSLFASNFFQNMQYKGSCRLKFDTPQTKIEKFMEKNSDFYEKYYDVILQVGSDISQGDNVLISADIGNLPLVQALADRAYELGAKKVQFNAYSGGVPLPILKNPERAEEMTRELKKQLGDYIKQDWALVYFRNSPYGNRYPKNIESQRLAEIRNLIVDANSELLNRRRAAYTRWTLFEVPSAKRGAMIFDLPTNETAMQKHLDTIKPILRLDAVDPVKAWVTHLKGLEKRAQVLMELDIEKIHVQGGKSDFTVELPRNAIWRGGRKETPLAKNFLANIPHEENFTTPNWRKTNGLVHIVKPVPVKGKYVEGAWFKFENGKIIDYGADKYVEALDQLFKEDPRSLFAGEIAFVDKNSIINKTDLIFKNILYDENASSHMALGNGYSNCILGGGEMSPSQLMAAGCNEAKNHIDFMFGTQDLNVWVYSRETGKKTQIMREGSFTEIFDTL